MSLVVAALVLAVVVVVGVTNADSIEVATSLWRSSSTREAVVAEAKAFHDANAPKASEATTTGADGQPLPYQPLTRAANDPIKQLEATALPIGWKERPENWALKIAGLLLSALAVSLGSGFWFDILGRVLQLRGTGPRVSPATGETESKGA